MPFVSFAKFIYNPTVIYMGRWEEVAQITSIKDLTSKLISVTEASRISGLTHSFICRLLRRGDIEGIKIGRNWLTTEEAVRKYLRQERRPGPKPRRKAK